MQIQLQQLIIPPGGQLLMRDVSWLMYEQLLAEYGEKRSARINYSEGVLKIVVPLPEHEDDKEIITDLVKVLLEELDLEFRSLGSTTFKSQAMQQGIEADSCFYIENEAAVGGKKRIDLAVDPLPDLALEIDLISRTRFDNYRILGVKELWRFDGTQLEINLLQDDRYIPSGHSYHFPVSIKVLIPQYLARSKVEGRNKTIKAFRAWVRAKGESR